jgi:NADH dehydrogenase
LLYQVATAGLSAEDIAYPIRSIFRRSPNTRVLMATVTGVEKDAKKVFTSAGPFPFDYLLVATGSQYAYFGHPEWEAFAPSLKTAEDAKTIRDRILLAFEAAEEEVDPKKREALMTFVLVGAGPTGVEMAGAIAELSHWALAKDFRQINPKSTRIVLLDSAPKILTAFPDSLGENAKKRLQGLGVEIRTGVRVECVDGEGVIVGGKRLFAKTVLWTAGVKASPVAQWLQAEADPRGRVKVTENLSLPGHPDIFVAGDAACVLGEDGKPLPGLASVAIQQGNFVAGQILKRWKNPALGPERFRYRDKGLLATIGRGSAIAQLGSLRIHGFVAWLLWLTVHIFYLIGFRNRFLVLFHWAWNYLTYQRGARIIAGGFRSDRTT